MKLLRTALVALTLVGCGNKGSENNAAQPSTAAPAAPTNPSSINIGQTQTLNIPQVPSLTVLIAEAGEYQIDVAGAPLDPVATLYRGDEQIERNDDIDGSNRNSRITKTLEPGTYRLVVLEYQGRPLTTTVTVTRNGGGKGANAPATPTPAAQPGTIAANQTAQLVVPAMPTMSFQISEAGWYRVTVDGNGKDPVAILYLADQLIKLDDDGNGGTNSRIQQELAPGAYRLVVLEFKGQQMSSSISLTRVEPPAAAATLAGGGEATINTLQGRTADDATVEVALNVTQAGSYQIRAEGTAGGDPKIALVQNGREIANDDDSGGGRAAMLTQELQPGSYRIRVVSFDNSAIPVRVTVRPPGAGGK